jgi:hypothetical protein
VRASASRRALFPFERRIAERRAHERRQSWSTHGRRTATLKPTSPAQ